MHSYYSPNVCYDYITKGRKCKYMRKHKAFLVDDTICIHPLAGEHGIEIPITTMEIFRKVGCYCFEVCEEKKK